MYQELRVRRVVADSLGVGLEELVRDVSLRDDLAADSLDLIELALALEAKFGISVPEHVLDGMRSYGDVVEASVDLIRARRAAESRSAEQPARFVARVVPSEGRSGGMLERGGWLTPYTVETIAEDALRAGRGARLEVTVAASTEDTGLARVRDDFACLGERGILVTVWREDENGVPEQHPPVASGATINGRSRLTSELLNLLTGVPTVVTITEYFGEDPWQAEDMIACTGKDGRRFGDATPAEQVQALSGRGPYRFVESGRGVAGDRVTAGDHHVHSHIHARSGQGPAGSLHVTEESAPRFEIGRGSAWNRQYYQADLCTRLGPNGELLPWRAATYYEREDRVLVTAGCMTPLAAGQPSARGQGLRMQFDLSAPSPNGFHLLTTTLGRSVEDDCCNLLVLVSAQLAGERRFAHVVVHGGSEPKIRVSLQAA
jgi:acyl carrier protein